MGCFSDNFSMHIWQDDPDRVFDFKNFEPTLRQFSREQLWAALEDKNVSQLTPDVKVVHGLGRESFFLFPDGSAVTLYRELNGAEHDPADPATLEFMTVPVYEDDRGNFSSVLLTEIWKPYWVKNDTDLTNIAVGGKTDFYEKTGRWPHFRFDLGARKKVFHKRNMMVPMVFFGEIRIADKKAYVFTDWSWADQYSDDLAAEVLRRPVTQSAWWNSDRDGAGFFVMFEDGAVPDWISLRRLKQPYVSFVEERRVPEGVFPRIAVGCQGDYLPDPPFNHFLYQIPIDFRTEDTPPGELNIGDSGSISVYWDKDNKFTVAYQQT